MPHPQIKFGTDGWRGVIADDFTFANVRIAAEAIAAYVHAKEDPAKGLCIGYDTRFESKAFARACAEVVAATGIPVRLANDITPTPALSYGVRGLGAAGGIMITSSHNPAEWNGVKYKAWYGGSGKPSIIAEIESHLGEPVAKTATPACIQEHDFLPAYLHAIESFADLDLIARSGLKFAIDSMYGAGAPSSPIFLPVSELRTCRFGATVNPLFPGINPEPIEPHIRALEEAVVANGCHAGLCTDGDADRIGAVDENGQLRRSAQDLFGAAELGAAPQRLAGSRDARLQHNEDARPHLQKVRPRAHRAWHRLQVCLRLHAGTGNRHGRRGIGRHRVPAPPAGARRPAECVYCSPTSWPKRARLSASSLPTCSRNMASITTAASTCTFPTSMKKAAIARAMTLNAGDPAFGSIAIVRRETLDGVKFYLDMAEAKGKPNAAETWILFRASGTEPLMRIYTESVSKESVAKLLEAGRRFALGT